MTLINRSFSGRTAAIPSLQYRVTWERGGYPRLRPDATQHRARLLRLCRLRSRLRDPHRNHPRQPEEQKIHRQKRRQACSRHGSLDSEADRVGDEIPHDHQADVDDEQHHVQVPGSFSLEPRYSTTFALAATSVPIPKFANERAAERGELRNRDTSNFMILVRFWI